MNAPQIPHDISPDGREIWDWAAKFSEHTHRLHKIHELSREIRELSTKCGSCRLWMTDNCPREVHSNATGRKTGPSMRGAICQKFAMKAGVAALIENKRIELREMT